MRNPFYISSNCPKHYYAGTQRVSSKIGTTENVGDYLYDWFTQGTGGPVDVIGSSFGVLENAEEGVIQVYEAFGIDPPTYDSSPVFIPVQSFVHGGNEVEQYYFHPDHLGSTSYITNLLGEVSQHMEYFAFGETFVEEHRSSNNSPYKFNGKELDEETGWYYYGARYYDPRISVWLSVDPLASYDPFQNSEHYIDGQHNGGVYNAKNLNVYGYTYQSPVVYLDPNGKQVHNANRPQFHYDSGFANFPKEEPTNQDRINFGKWVAKATVAQAIMPDAANAYLHYMGNTGSHRTFALHKYINEDPSGQELLIFMKSIAMENAEGVLTSLGRITYYSQGFTVGDIGDFSYPQTENWQKAVGAFNVYYKADLTATKNNAGGLTYKLNLTIYGEDMYNFNPGNTDLATGTPDAVNGRFEVIGWAKGYLQSGAAKLKEPIVWDSNNSKNKDIVP